VVDDTNILYRKDLHTLHRVKQMAQDALQAKNQEEKHGRYAELRAYCHREQVSPGGSADLLAVTVFFFFVEALFFDAISREC
jgi:triphosphoribosyl-dephospho-CoA synthetase